MPTIDQMLRAQQMAQQLGLAHMPGIVPHLLQQMMGGAFQAAAGMGGMAAGLWAAGMGGMGLAEEDRKPAKPPVLRLDAEGREVDEEGNVVERGKGGGWSAR